MNPCHLRPRHFRRVLFAIAASFGFGAAAQHVPFDATEWSTMQSLEIPAVGLHKIALPTVTLGSAQPGLGDLRVLHPRGGEVPFALEIVRPDAGPDTSPGQFSVTLEPGSTRITIETRTTNELKSLTLATAARDFIKPVHVEGSTDQLTWTTLARGVPVFRQGGASRLSLALAPRSWPWLRLTLDDRTSPPIGFTGVSLQARTPTTPTTPLPVVLEGRSETNRHTRLTLRLPARHLRVATLEFDTPEPLFMREVTILGRVATDVATNEVALARGTIHRLAVDGQPASVELSVPVEVQSLVDEWIIDIANQDNPPLALTSVSLRLRPVYLVLRADEPGTYSLLSGNPRSPAPRYDVASLLGPGLAAVAESKIVPGAPVTNPAYRPAPALPGVPEQAAALDITRWRQRKAVQAGAAGVQLLELDLEVLSRARPDLADLRLLRGGEQVPYLFDGTSATRIIPANAERLIIDPKRPRLSRWRLKLPHARLPITHLACSSPTALFHRQVTLSEEVRDERGSVQTLYLGSASWIATPAAPARSLSLEFQRGPLTDTLVLETDNGDNPAVELEHFEFTCRVPRLLFKLTGPPDDLWLFYGNERSTAPSYDLQLIGRELRSAPRATAVLGASESVSKDPWGDRMNRLGSSGPVFWAVLVLVTGTLLGLILRFLPKATP